MIDKGVCLVLLWLQPPIFAHQTMPSLIMLEAGVILHFTTLTSLSLFSNTLLITKLELSLFLTEGYPAEEGEESGSQSMDTHTST